MPKGIRDHQHKSEGSTEKLYLKVGESDPNTARPGEVPEGLLPETERKIFVQVAALNGMQSTDTFEFMRQFLRPSICHSEVATMIDNYRADIIAARNAVALYVDQKFPAFNPFKQAEAINRGLSLCTTLMNKYATYIDRSPKVSNEYKDSHDIQEVQKWEQEAAAKWVDRANRGISSLTKTYEIWDMRKVEWGKMVEAITADFAAQVNPAQATKLDPRKIAAVAKHVGVDDFIADRLAQLLVYGEQNLTSGNEEEDQTAKYFTKAGGLDGDAILQGVDGGGVQLSGAVEPEDPGHRVLDQNVGGPADGGDAGRVQPTVKVTRSILPS